MNKKIFLLPLLFVLICLLLSSSSTRPVFSGSGSLDEFVYLPIIVGPGVANANEGVPEYNGQFRYGLNPGYFGPNWSDGDVAQLCYDAGCRSSRGTLPDHFIGQWGVNIRVNEFQHVVNNLQFGEITTFLEGPRDEWRDTAVYGGQQSKLWQGMYEPIFDNGENGTPVNDNNRFALYVWLIATTYGDYITFYEIINEPDFTYTNHGWEEPGVPGNWWENPPQPQDMTNVNAPVYQYIRLLRIAYEVIKLEDPTAFVTPGGIGYPSFLDVLLRYTDNPNGGQVTAEYPLTGGAYFTALSYHSYPHFLTRYWNGSQWVPDRHSDKAVDVLLTQRDDMETLLHSYGYDGNQYPEKIMLVTELNVPRKQVGDNLGGAEMQRNFTIKAQVKSQQADIKQIYWYLTGELEYYNVASNDPFDFMGFYEKLHDITPGNQVMTTQGIANLTVSQQLYGWDYDAAATAALSLPNNIDGAAFSQGGQVRYVLWAKTTLDNSESANATITLPGTYTKVIWDGTSSTISGTNIALTGAPIFLTQQ